MSKEDTSENGPEPLIMLHMSGASGLVLRPGGIVVEAPLTKVVDR